MPEAKALAAIRAALRGDEATLLTAAVAAVGLDTASRRRIETLAVQLIEHVRANEAGLLETLMSEYGLSDDEGLALMCLAEAYLRVPDSATVDALLRDKLTGQGWSRHLGHADSLLVNASTFGLLLSRHVLGDDGRGGAESPLRRWLRRAGEPMVRSAVGVAMRHMAEQFVLGRTIEEAVAHRSAGPGQRYSYDMLGEAARTAADAQRYFEAYRHAIAFVASHADKGADVFGNPGISVKLSALHPRYQASQHDRLMDELVPRLAELARMAAAAGVGLNVDAEEANRLELSLSVVDAVLDDPALAGWQGFGLVVQAYSKPALAVLDWCADRARALGRPMAVRLVKGAYWDAEIRHAQLLGLSQYPVYTRKVGTDVAYLAAARRLFSHRGWLYPQFATHNAHTVAAVLSMAKTDDRFEFQRLHGMGEVLHRHVAQRHGRPCRVYAPVGAHKDLLAYLVRRMLENGANASFVHQVHDKSIAASELARDPIDELLAHAAMPNPAIPLPPDLYLPERRNSNGRDPENPGDLVWFERAVAPWAAALWRAEPIGPPAARPGPPAEAIVNPARPSQVVGHWRAVERDTVADVVAAMRAGQSAWAARPITARAAVLDAVAESFESHAGELLAMLVREAGKHRADAMAELREAIDFCRYYAALARRGGALGPPRGVWVCISPWNFPLAIFTGQIMASLVVGNAVIAKPAELTPLIAARAVELMLASGVPHDALALMPGDGAEIGAALVSHPGIAGVSFTGSLATAVAIDRAMADHGNACAPLVAETGGLNAMIVDSTALPEAAVRDIVQSAFQSAGQRCSALRLLLVQREIADAFIEMLAGAMDELRLGDPWMTGPDIGPVIAPAARDAIEAHIAAHADAGRLTHRGPDVSADAGWAVAPALIRLERVADLDREVFGPVLHWLPFEASELEAQVDAINAAGYGLTFGLQTRIDRRASAIAGRIAAGNVYVNRNQIGAVVGVQPFGGEGLSGTGPKAGGPNSFARLCAAVRAPQLVPAFGWAEASRLRAVRPMLDGLSGGQAFDERLGAMRRHVLADGDAIARFERLERAFALGPEHLMTRARFWVERIREPLLRPRALPGPTGETNRLRLHPRGLALCLGGEDDPDILFDQFVRALACGNAVLLAGKVAERVAAPIFACLQAAGLEPLSFAWLTDEQADSLLDGGVGPDLVLLDDDPTRWRDLRRRLAARDGARVPIVEVGESPVTLCVERVVSVDTTASGGNAQLLALGD
ncbi:MAG: bifunctional proline dehydrogenase/L-glutamate gamma-semialdehyde dehydrogenase PutA [Burkholderiaceae bacterium]